MDAGTMYANAKALHELLQEERVESAKLRHDLEEANNQAEEVCIENAKLRELVSGLYKCWLNEGCEGCPMQDDGGWCVRDIRLRELGVEVDA